MRMKTKKQTAFLLKDILPDVINTLSPSNIPAQLRLEQIWQKVAAGEADKAVFAGHKEGTLFVHVDGQARLFRMRMRRQSLLTQIQKHCPEVHNIVFRIGKVT